MSGLEIERLNQHPVNLHLPEERIIITPGKKSSPGDGIDILILPFNNKFYFIFILIRIIDLFV